MVDSRRLPLFAGALLLLACNPNFGMGNAPDAPPDWKSPNGSGGSEGGGVPTMDELFAKLLEKAKADPKDVESRKQLGLLYAEEGKWDDAAKILEEAEAIDPKNVEVRVTRAKVLVRRKDQGAAKMELEAATRLAPDDEAVLREWGDYYILADQPADAIKVRKKLLEKHPDIEDAESLQKQMFYLGRIPKLRDTKKLKEFFDLVGAAAQLQEKGSDAEAIPKFQGGLALLPDDPNLWADLGFSQCRSGKKEDGIASLKKALTFDKDNSRARVELARALFADGDKRGAIATLKDWQKVDARRAKQHDVAGMIAKLEKGEALDAVASAPSQATHSAPSQGQAGVIRGTVTLAPALAARVPPNTRLYVFAKTNPGGGPPLAVHVEPAPSFPYSFQLSGSDVMMQGSKFEGSVYLTARLDADGTAGAGPGDLEGATGTAIPVGSDGVEIVIDKIRGADNKLTTADGSAPANAPSVAMAAAPPAAAAGAGGATVSGTIDLAASVKSRVPASATLFIFAKANAGGGPPMAVYREPITSATKFPMPFSLSQGNVMMPGVTFAGPVFITARIDVDGVAGAGPGDLEGMTKSPVPVGTQGLQITIDTVR